MTAQNLVDALGIDRDRGVTCVVGAGGKKSTLYALADRLERAIVTATVRIPPFEEHVASLEVTADPIATAHDAVVNAEDEPDATPDGRWPLGLVAARERTDRYRGYEPAVVDDLAAAVDVPILVKADGARTRWLKAPNDREPQLPAAADTVIPIASARVVGETLDDTLVHRPERVAAVTGLEVGDEITAEAVATVLTSERGGWKGVPDGATVVPLLNMVDTPALERTTREVGTEILRQRDVTRVVLTRLLEDRPVVDILE
ncbi:selenium cofactor biosynthesis protein YqeC [Natrononativus amylolyticus]|uniref:selenium cofactor biosynthesis protein YqeC n=1 Tax=Natrononativus amylolyticus TaxID=2963434 RepID=UPI0020CC10C0|nr:selenium cofactor biosynthesis protein YqeC [Natrononativus amylolyticus]